jgi:hypothetical protein
MILKTLENKNNQKKDNTQRNVLFILEKQLLFSYTSFPVKRINVGKILKL